MASKEPENVAAVSPLSGKRRQNVVLVVGLGLLALGTWHAGKGGACFNAGCMIPEFPQTMTGGGE